MEQWFFGIYFKGSQLNKAKSHLISQSGKKISMLKEINFMIGSGLRVREDIGICIKSYCLELEPNPPKSNRQTKKITLHFVTQHLLENLLEPVDQTMTTIRCWRSAFYARLIHLNRPLSKCEYESEYYFPPLPPNKNLRNFTFNC